MKRNPHQGQRIKGETGRWPRQSAARRGRDDGFGIDWGGEPKAPALPAPGNQMHEPREESMASDKKHGGLCKKCREKPYTSTTSVYAYLCDDCANAKRERRAKGEKKTRAGTATRARARRKPKGDGRPPMLAGDFETRLGQLVAAYDEGLTVLLELGERSFVLQEVELSVKE